MNYLVGWTTKGESQTINPLDNGCTHSEKYSPRTKLNVAVVVAAKD